MHRIGSFFESLVSNSKGPIKCLSLNKHLCQARPTLVNINLLIFNVCSFTVSVNKCGGNCNTIDDPYARVCVPKKVKNMNVKVFNLMSRVNERRFLAQRKSFECKCRLNKSICKSKQKWNHNECRCECKKLGDVKSKKSYMWNLSTCNCECNKACKSNQYLDTKNCSCEKCLIGKLVLECEDEKSNATKTENKVAYAKSNYLIHTISY